ncbi:hypothetical protein M8818_005521 [Zalaria obscura]|uniref:Uncharacterized protein n=1 Tax=Zalaria obscura TaxID=2024903 RepID=A0ACC3S867_9PEZI
MFWSRKPYMSGGVASTTEIYFVGQWLGLLWQDFCGGGHRVSEFDAWDGRRTRVKRRSDGMCPGKAQPTTFQQHIRQKLHVHEPTPHIRRSQTSTYTGSGAVYPYRTTHGIIGSLAPGQGNPDSPSLSGTGRVVPPLQHQHAAFQGERTGLSIYCQLYQRTQQS